MELYQLCAILEKISQVDDVRPVLAQFISNNTVNFAEADRILKIGKSTERPTGDTPTSGNRQYSPKPAKDPYKVKPIYTQDERKEIVQTRNPNESRTTDQREPKGQKMMSNTWVPNNRNLTEQFKNFTMMNQYNNAMGLNNLNSEMQKLLSETLSSYNPGGRNYMKESRKSSKRASKTRGHGSNHRSHSRKKKSPSRGRNDPNHIFLNLMKQSLRSSKKHRKNYSTNDGHLNRSSKRSKSRRSRANNTPKRGIKYSTMFGRKAGSTRVSRKGSAANSNERGAYSTYAHSRMSPKSKKKKASMDYDFSNTNSFTNMMMRDMGVSSKS